jgi:hypothetical protein
VSSSLPGSLSASSPIFYRPGGDNIDYYYFQAIQINVPVDGIYILTTNSTVDTRGYFYYNFFDPSEPTLQLVTDNDDGGTFLQFRIEVYLQLVNTYVLVVTTHRPFALGNFLFLASGPAFVSLTSITPSTSRPITTCKYLTKTFFILLVSMGYLLKRQRSFVFGVIHFNNLCF